MPNYAGRPEQPEDKALIFATEELDSYKAQRANLAVLLEVYRNTGIADQQLIRMGLVHG